MQSRDKRAGILLHITSLPSPDGIGTFGKQAYGFIDFLRDSGQKYWQILPLNTIGKGNSPYSSPCAFALNPLLCDAQFLKDSGLICEDQLCNYENIGRTDYETAKLYKQKILNFAVENFDIKDKNYIEFCRNNKYWLDNYALFTVLSDAFGSADFLNWQDGYKYRDKETIEFFTEKNSDKIEKVKTEQFLVYEQWYNLKKYANKSGIEIIGDIPFYVCLNSVDVWANPKLFKVGKNLVPTLVAGVPPDYFSANGQLWGNPIYDWAYQRKTGYKWWIQRLEMCSQLYDIVRIDHFRAFADYYTIPYGSKNAVAGSWKIGEGMHFFDVVKQKCGDIRIIAENLGQKSSALTNFMEECGYPSMKVLQFAFNVTDYEDFLPENYNDNCVVYTGTHDNDTTNGWYRHLSADEMKRYTPFAAKTIGETPAEKLIITAMKSRANTVIVPMQDYLNLGSDARMNSPGISVGNWTWRMDDNTLTDKLSEKIRTLSLKRLS